MASGRRSSYLPLSPEPGFQTAAGVGFLGGFTTFSTFTVQAVLDVDAGEPGRAFIYVAVSVMAGLAAAAGGYALARAIH